MCSRFTTYDVKLEPACLAYCKVIMVTQAILEWIEGARSEPDELEELDVEF